MHACDPENLLWHVKSGWWPQIMSPSKRSQMRLCKHGPEHVMLGCEAWHAPAEFQFCDFSLLTNRIKQSVPIMIHDNISSNTLQHMLHAPCITNSPQEVSKLLRSGVADYIIFFTTLLQDIIFQWCSYTCNTDQHVSVEHNFLFLKSLNLPPQTMFNLQNLRGVVPSPHPMVLELWVRWSTWK